jgi:hypothetical protein
MSISRCSNRRPICAVPAPSTSTILVNMFGARQCSADTLTGQ